MRLSKQRLGDNPRDHDGIFTGLGEEIAGPSGVRPDADYSPKPGPINMFEPWKIYPRPPPPHWHWKGDESSAPDSVGARVPEPEEFDFSQCHIPGADDREFRIDDRGVYQVYDDSDIGRECLSFRFCCHINDAWS